MFNRKSNKFIYEYSQKRSDNYLLIIIIILGFIVGGYVYYTDHTRKIGEVDPNIKKFVYNYSYEIKEYKEDTNTIMILIDKKVKDK